MFHSVSSFVLSSFLNFFFLKALETQSSEEELKKILGSVHSDQPLVSYNHSGKINFSQIENAGISSNENYQFQGEPFRLNSIITFVIDFEKVSILNSKQQL